MSESHSVQSPEAEGVGWAPLGGGVGRGKTWQFTVAAY